MPHKQPLVSVIIPLYNHEKYVINALTSVVNQTHSNLEVIIIDDGSKDASAQAVERFIDSTKGRKFTFFKQENLGAHAAINRGLSMAQGEYLTILNSDDYYHPERIEKILKHIRDAGSEIAFSYVSGVDDKGSALPLDHWWRSWYESSKVKLFHAPTVGFHLLQENVAVSSGNLFFSKRLFQQVGQFKKLKLAHDMDFLVRALPHSEPIVVREDLYFYRHHDHNTIHQVKHLMNSELRQIYRDYLTLVSEKPPHNRMAPSHWHWPLEFGKLCWNLRMDRELNGVIASSKQTLPLNTQAVPIPTQHIKKPITLFTHDLSLSGAPKLVADLALSLKSNGYVPNVIALKAGPMKAEFDRFGIDVFVIPKMMQWWTKPRNLISRILGFALLLPTLFWKTRKLTIAATIANWPAILPLVLLQPFRRLLLYTNDYCHISGVIHRRLLPTFLKRLNRRQSVHLWYGSQSTQAMWHDSRGDGEVMYWSGIPVQVTRKIIRKRLTNILSVGTALARKGTHYLVDAFIACVKEKKIPDDVVLSIVGFPDAAENETSPSCFVGEILLKVIHSGLQDRIRLIGAVTPEQLEAYYNEADLFIQSSLLECLPISLLTAMSKGLPIITTNVNGCAEAIEHLQSGYLCLPYSTQSLMDAIILAFENPERSLALGLKAQLVFNEKFSLEVTQENILKSLDTLEKRGKR